MKENSMLVGKTQRIGKDQAVKKAVNNLIK